MNNTTPAARPLTGSDFYAAFSQFAEQVAALNAIRKANQPNAKPLDPKELWKASQPEAQA